VSKAPFAPLDFARPEVSIERREGGVLVLRSVQRLAPYSRCVGEWLQHWALETPAACFLAERKADGWRQLSYRDALAQVRQIGSALLQRGLSSERPVAILSDNSIDHALLTLGALHVGIAVAPISPAYSLMSKDHAKLKGIMALLKPGLVYAADGARFAAALAALELEGAEVVVSANAPVGIKTTAFEALLGVLDEGAVDLAFASVGPDTIAKFLFTSGSTGEPKGVINTQRMLCANQQSIAQVWPFLAVTPPVVVDWLPWNHTFGANHNFNMVLRNGGTLYLDDGKPMPGLVDKTIANLREIAPTLYFNVPRGFDMILPMLEQDGALRKNFFSRLQMIFYAAAALPQNLWQRLEQLSIQERGERVIMLSAWGSTETAPMITTVHFPIERAGVIGLPGPGSELKMIPTANKMEMRVRGPNVTPGYWKRDDLTRAAFDEEGFYMIGDAGRFADPQDPAKGVEFDGRIAEDFKLTSGTWVHTGKLRVNAVSELAPVAQDVVVTGHDREEIGLLVFPNLQACRALCPELPESTPMPQILADSRVVGCVRSGLRSLASKGAGSSTFATRALLMEELPSIDAGEITDKGYINQRAVRTRRADLVAQLYGGAPDSAVIRVGAIARPTASLQAAAAG
jgi:feruloyl-CoA synthase